MSEELSATKPGSGWRMIVGAGRCLMAAVCLSLALCAGRMVVPTYMGAQRDQILLSAERHGIAPEVLAAVLYNEMLGQEHRLLSSILPGDGAAAAVRESLLGWHFLTLKQAQWTVKGVVALIGLNTTVGPTGIRVSVGREIRSEVAVNGGLYQAAGLWERPSLVLDLMRTSTAVEYLAANLERGARRAAQGTLLDWTACARWHNTGLTADRPDVPRPIWDKGTRYVARVQAFLPEARALVNRSATPVPLLTILRRDEGLPVGMIGGHLRPATVIIGAQ